ncbi:eight-cysteine-cluster domain-containing protein [Thermoproteota archaeon]
MDQKILKKIMLVLLFSCAVFALGCKDAPIPIPEDIDIDKDLCEYDSDCICGGHDADGSCFMGNKEYYDLYVDKSEDCPDFCTGIAGNMMLRCVANRCIQTFECLTSDECESGTCQNNKCAGGKPRIEVGSATGCTSDKDCVTGGCSGTVCQHKKAEPIFTTCEFKPEYACYKSDAECGCVKGDCEWKKEAGFDECVYKLRGS